ncbi:gp35 hinge connector of long tail fiber [Acinetobacter phage Acj61]|uniref:Gp35 hinge connector of long tail fiber n=1 Tax=Acinetobacter phage Acj61 TaxID=760732 RepID=E5E4L2_9CAUD|nr:long tail fiber protein proximal connector [Acinetobacter phage Acj61]ADG36196.1 gp35 hinge connector of long tail fiber [Acinetobacter phage Acj61]
MAETLMMNVDKDLISVRMVSESNSVAYKMNIGVPSSGNPKNAYLKINDKELHSSPGSVTSSTGLNIRTFNTPDKWNEVKNFTLSSNDASTINTGFIDYMNSVTDKLVVIYSGTALRSSARIDDWFASVSSKNWPGADRCNRFSFTYIGLYSPSKRKIIAEAYKGYHDLLPNDSFNTLEVVYDSLDDIGAVGFAKSAVYDSKEYVTTSEYEFVRYPTDAGLVAPLADYGLRPNSLVMLSGELFQSAELVAAGLVTRLNVRWYRGTTLRDSFSISPPVDVKETWWKMPDTFLNIPADADGFTIVAARYPRNDALNALAGIKNIALTEVGRKDEKSTPASIGVNGIKTNNLVEGTNAPMLLQLVDPETFAVNNVPVVALRELELEY